MATTKLPELPRNKNKNSPSPAKPSQKIKKQAKNSISQANESQNQTNRSKNKKNILMDSFANIPRFNSNLEKSKKQITNNFNSKMLNWLELILKIYE